MKVLHVITDLNTGGAEKLLVDLVPLLKKEIDVQVALFNGLGTPLYDALKKANIKIHIFSKGGSVYKLSNIYKLIRLSKKFDIVHTHNTAPQLYGAIASLFTKAKFCTTEHTTTSHHRVWWFAPIERWMYGRYGHVMCISKATQENMQVVAGAKAPKSTIIPNGIDINIYRDATSINKDSINTYSNSNVLLMVGRYSYQKDQATIIRAMPFVPSDVELWLAGYGETHDNLAFLAKEENVSDRVHLLGLRTDVPNLLKSCDIVIQSSHIEGFGLAAVEGMAAGKPVIASDVQGLAQVVKNAGVLFEHGNEKALAEEICKLLNDVEYYNKIACQCETRATSYDISNMRKGYLQIYKRLLNERI